MSLLSAFKTKSNQLNADDLLSVKTKIIVIQGIDKNDQSEQPVVIHYQGEQGKPWKPCKTAVKVIEHLWGTYDYDTNNYQGRAIELYRDDTVLWAGEAVGGIRIKAMTDINERRKINVALNNKKKINVTVEPLVFTQPTQQAAPQPAPSTKEQEQKAYDVCINSINRISEANHVIMVMSSPHYKYLKDNNSEFLIEVDAKLQAKENELKAEVENG